MASTDVPTPVNAPGPTAPQPTPAQPPLPQTSQGGAPPAGEHKEVNIGSAVAAYNEKRKREKKSPLFDGIPTELAPRWEIIVDESTKRIKAKRDAIKIAIGDKPYRGIPVTEAEAKIRYLRMRGDSKLQEQALEENVTMTKGGRLLVNKEYLSAIRKMEKELRKGEGNTT